MKKKRIIAWLMTLCMLFSVTVPATAADNVVPVTALAEKTTDMDVTLQDDQTAKPDEDALVEETEIETSNVPQPRADSVIYVSGTKGNDETGTGTEESPYATLSRAVTEAGDGGTIYLMEDITISSLAFVDGKTITINGQGHTVTRADNFTAKGDTARGGYNPAMIEVANSATLTLVNITLDDNYRYEGTEFLEQVTGDGDKNNDTKVQDAIIAAYRGGGTIVLSKDTVLKNFGGMSAIRIGGPGQGGEGTSTLVMESGSKIVDEASTENGRAGGVAAVWSQGGKLEMKEGAEISGISGRAVFLEDGALASVRGSIYDISSNDKMTLDPATGTNLGKGAMNDGFAGIAVAALGNSTFTLADQGSISNIKSADNNSADVATFMASSSFVMDAGSTFANIETIGLMDNNGGSVTINGTVRDCKTNKVFFRMRGGSGNGGDFTLGEQGVITDSSTTDAGIIYVQHGTPDIQIDGEISNCTISSGGAIFMTQNGILDGTCTITGTIKNISGGAGYAITVDGPSKVTIDGGTITGCSSYAIRYKGYRNSLLDIKSGTIENNNNGAAQIKVEYASNVSATDTLQHIQVQPETLIGNTTIDLPTSVFDVTLDENYQEVALGQAGSAAVEKIKSSVNSEHADWKVIGSGALWLRPTAESIHFTASRPSGATSTGLFVAYIPLKEDGTPAEDATLVTKDVENTDQIDVTLTGLNANTAYAVMFVNNDEYTLAPDDITIYTGGGQGDEVYDNGGFPAVTLTNCLDEITSLRVNDQTFTGDEAMAKLLECLTATYTDKDGNPVTSDVEAGEYTINLSWKGGQKPGDLRINGNEVADQMGTGTLIVRHIEEIEEAQNGNNTHALLESEPTAPVTHAEAIAKSFLGLLESKFYTNDDADREVDSAGIQLLDDALLIDDDGTNRQSLLEAKAESTEGLLYELNEGQTYRYDFHYLDLVDAYNGNAWVSASYGTTVYLPYPEGVTSENAEAMKVQVIHFPGLHREYGIAGQVEVTEAIAACTPEKMDVNFTENGISFETDRAGFSPFAVVWQNDMVTYTITATAGNGGSISPSGSVTVTEGEDQTFAITPNSGYSIADVTVDGASVGAVRTYTFEDVDANHTINATFTYNGGGTITPDPDPDPEPTPDPDEPGIADPDDTGVADWLNTEDHEVFLNGYPDGSFGPDRSMTRAEVAAMFSNLLLDKNVPITTSFSDVAEDAWYADAVNMLASLDMIAGYEDGTFRPDAPITRAEFTAIAMRFADATPEGENIFSDVHAGDWFYDVVVGSIQYGWIGGYEDGTFRPQNTITRAEVTAITNRMLGRVADEAFIDAADELRSFSDLSDAHWAYYSIMEATNAHDYTTTDGVEEWEALH